MHLVVATIYTRMDLMKRLNKGEEDAQRVVNYNFPFTLICSRFRKKVFVLKASHGDIKAYKVYNKHRHISTITFRILSSRYFQIFHFER